MITNESFKHYLVGNEKFDQEHWEILEVLNNIASDISREKLVSLMKHARELWITHSKHEEDAMDAIGYPYAKYHVKEHDDLKKKLCDIVNRVETDSTFTPKHFVGNFQHTICSHIEHYDMQITNFINRTNDGNNNIGH